ncbi:Cyclin D6 1 [Euphorbia peplus]|nr:Cyclin D6 1 [Euphorbia peplus]
MEFDLENPLTSCETIQDLFASESDHMPSTTFFQSSHFYSSFRQEALSLVLQAQYSCNLGGVVGYLAVNYMDRFISSQEIQSEKPWILRLLVISCLSLAAKMKNTHFSLSHFQGEESFIFDTESINRMELLVLDALDWRMRSITPFSFLPFFISLFELKDLPLTQTLKGRATEIIFKAHNGIKFLEFKPSIIAASAVLVACHELFPLHFTSFNSSISSSQCVNNENLEKSLKAMKEMVEMEWYESMMDTISSTRTPLSVLDRHCTISESFETTSSITTVPTNTKEIKKRRTNSYYSRRK